jgi:hypothetical protein
VDERASDAFIFDKSVFAAFKDISDFEVWEIDSRLVNGKTPVQQWLPYFDIIGSSP